MREVGRSAFARVGTFVPIALATLMTSHIVISEYGVDSFTGFQVMLTSGFILLAFADLGVGAAVTNVIASDGVDGARTAPVVLTALLTLVSVSLGLQLVNIVVGASFGWTTILGGIDASTLQLGLSAAIFAACVPLGLAQSVLLGAGRNHTAVLLLALYPPLVLAGVLGCMILDLASTWTVVVPPAALFLTLCVTAWRAMRLVDLGWRSVLERVPFVRSTKGSRIRQMAVPKFLIAVTAASTLHADRIVLNHVGSTESVASYSLAAQIFAPALAVITAGVAPIWPMYEKARSQGAPAPRVIYVMAAFTAGAALMCVPLVLVASYAASLISDDRVGVSLGLALSWACVIVAQAAAASVAMTRMDRDGIRFISRWCIASAPVNIALSVVLAATWGAAGPLIATALTVTVMQAMPIYLFHRLRPVAQKPDKTEVAVEKMP